MGCRRDQAGLGRPTLVAEVKPGDWAGWIVVGVLVLAIIGFTTVAIVVLMTARHLL